MKEARALDVSGDGMIDANEFQRLVDPNVVHTATLKAKVDALWAAMPKTDGGSVERLKCWAILLADDELALAMGKNDLLQGKQYVEPPLLLLSLWRA